MSPDGLLCSSGVCAEAAVWLALAMLTQIVVAQVFWCQGTEAKQSFVDGRLIASSAATTQSAKWQVDFSDKIWDSRRSDV